MFFFRTEQKPDPQATISKLADRLANATFLEDRKAAVLGLKGLSRDYTLVKQSRFIGRMLELLAYNP